jgi:low temperature requirement protein LtrA
MRAMPTTVLRERSDDEAPRVTNLELFFDLVYVFAVTQLSEFLFRDLTLRAALEGLIMFIAVWWAWDYTAWATNWLDPERWPAALLIVVLMVFSLVMSAAIPDAFHPIGNPDRGLVFAVSYVALQLVRSTFMVLSFPRRDRMRRNFAQLLSWSAISGAVWIAGAILHGDARLLVWAIAVVLDVGAPVHGYRLPGIRATPMEGWSLAGAHLAERCQLVLMIALGESVLRVGLTWSQQRGSAAVDTAFFVGFVASASLWATYFLRTAESGARVIASEQGGRTGRSAYAYAHAVMVAGVIVEAVGIRSSIEFPTRAASVGSTSVILGGPVLYLVGLVLFKRLVHHGRLGPPIAGIGVLALLSLLAVAGADELVIAICAAVVLAALAVGSALGADGLRDA